MKKALITGITGQDGAYLVKYLLELGYKVIGLKRRSSIFNSQRIDDVFEKYAGTDRFEFYYFDLSDFSSIVSILQKERPDEIYNLAAQSHVKVSFDLPEYTGNNDGLGTLRFLEAIRILNLPTKFYQASTSELYGKVQETPQTEKTPFYPRSPYGVAKLYAYWIVRNYREAYGIHASNGILFNHESPLRGETFVTRKITRGLSRIFINGEGTLTLGNLDSIRDWGHAEDYVKAMHLIANAEEADDWVVSTGVGASVRDFIHIAASYCGVLLESMGEKENEVLRIIEIDLPKWCKKMNQTKPPKEGQIIVTVDPKYYRPTEVDLLIGDSSKIRRMLGWQPTHTLNSLVDDMMSEDLNNFKKKKIIINQGYHESNSMEDII